MEMDTDVQNNSHDTHDTHDTHDDLTEPAKTQVIARPLADPSAIPGLHELQENAANNPTNGGLQIALATAYVHMGRLEEGLRVYRRMLSRPNATYGVVVVIQERLSDLEDQGEGKPNFHLLRGDLYMRQGHIREAVDEYNKIV
jgi:pentatricopeptide repeat protein